jgi:hypothetical protein
METLHGHAAEVVCRWNTLGSGRDHVDAHILLSEGNRQTQQKRSGRVSRESWKRVGEKKDFHALRI